MSHQPLMPVYGRVVRRDLDAERERVRQYLATFIGTHGYAPSYTQIRDGCDMPSTSYVAPHLDALAASGIIERAPGVPRSIRMMA